MSIPGTEDVFCWVVPVPVDLPGDSLFLIVYCVAWHVDLPEDGTFLMVYEGYDMCLSL